MLSVNVNTLSESEKLIANYLFKNTSIVPNMSIDELSSDINISTATISRFCKKVGYPNFKALKRDLLSNINSSPADKVKNTMIQLENKDLIHNIINQHIANLEKTLNNIDRNSFEKSIHYILNCKRLIILAPGPSLGLAQIFKYRLNRFGINIDIINSSGSEIFEHMINIKEDDAVIIFGFTKMLVEIEVFMNYVKKINCPCILFTDLMISEMIELADVSLYACRGDIWEFHSMVSPLAVLDCLIVGIALETENKALDNMQKLTDLRNLYKEHIKR